MQTVLTVNERTLQLGCLKKWHLQSLAGHHPWRILLRACDPGPDLIKLRLEAQREHLVCLIQDNIAHTACTISNISRSNLGKKPAPRLEAVPQM